MIKVLFICHGNICRSPMAEFVMKDMVRARGLEDVFEIASAATSSEEIGNPIHPGTVEQLKVHGVPFDKRKARRITKADYENYDHIVCMDMRNVNNTIRVFGGDPDGKVSLLLDHTGVHRDVADPWYTGMFGETWDDVNEGCRALLEEIL